MTILEARKKTEMTRIKSSEVLGIPLRTLEEWEAGRRDPSPWAERLVINELTKIYLINSGGTDADVLKRANGIILRERCRPAKEDYYHYDEISSAALKNPTEENLYRLGMWFEAFGADFWNGEVYTVDKSHDLRPVYLMIDEDEYETIGFELI